MCAKWFWGPLVAAAADSATAVSADSAASYSCAGATIAFNCSRTSSSTWFAVYVPSATVKFFALSRSASEENVLHLAYF